jgi:hypothetical protein
MQSHLPLEFFNVNVCKLLSMSPYRRQITWSNAHSKAISAVS